MRDAKEKREGIVCCVSMNDYMNATSVCSGNSCRDSAHSLQNDSGKRKRRRRMETESPQGLNLHPAKQPRTTLFDWLPAGLPSVPTWTNLHGTNTDRSVFLFSFSSSASYFFVFSISFSLLSFCFFGTISLFFLFSFFLARH